jgi:PKD repeat protein
MSDPVITAKDNGDGTCTLTFANVPLQAFVQPPPQPPTPAPPKADFTVQVDGAVATVTDASTNVASETWDFGDGTTADNNGNAAPQSHTYAPGTYTIELGVTGLDGSVVGCAKPVTINAPADPTPPSAGAGDANPDGTTDQPGAIEPAA